MSVTINVNNLSLCHKGSNGVSTASLPDVCKTPSPGGPVPLPYPNVSMSSDLENGTSTVTADGGNMIAIKGSDFSRSTGDEPGTVGGLKSNVNMKESKWILYSFDVKIEGSNACRLTDKKTQNGANTVDAQGEVQAPLPPAQLLELAVCNCDKLDPKPGESCQKLGERKHSCCNRTVKRLSEEGVNVGGEQGYDRTTGQPTDTVRHQMSFETREEFLSRISGKAFPDASIKDANGNVEKFIDFKFACPKPPRKSAKPRIQTWSKGQKQKYIDLGAKMNPSVTEDPEIISNENC